MGRMSAPTQAPRQPIQKDDWRLTVAPMMDWTDKALEASNGETSAATPPIHVAPTLHRHGVRSP